MASNQTQDTAIREFMDRFIQMENGTPSIDELIRAIGEYYKADRSYIFEKDDAGVYFPNTYEWCAEGVNAEKQNLQKVPVAVLDPWMDEFRAKGSFYLSCDDEYAKTEPLVYEVLEPQGISSLIAAPFMRGSEIIGFLGVDNPKVHTEQQLYLSVAAAMLNHQLLALRTSAAEQKHNVELQKALDAARESSAMLDRVHEVLGSAPWKIEYDESGNESRAEFSDGLRRLFGYEDQEDFPNSLEFWLSLVYPDDYKHVTKDVYEVLSSRNQKAVTISTRYRAYRKDRTIRWYRVQGLVKRREDGSPQLAYGVISDITELEKAEIGQQEAMDAVESIHDSLGSANWQMTFSESGEMTSCTWSDRFRRMLDYQGTDDFPNELSSWTDLLHPADKKMTLNAYWAAVNDRTGKTSYNVRYRLLTRTRGYRWYAAHGSLTRYGNGAPKVYYGMFLDINDQVLTAQSQEANIREISELNRQMEEKQAELEAAAEEQNAQMEEITALNAQLEENQTKLEESASEQEAQIEEITALNDQLEQNQAELEASVAEIEEERAKVSEAYGIIKGFSQDYHTIWLVNKQTLKMQIIRSSARKTIGVFAHMVNDLDYDAAIKAYVNGFVDEKDKERVCREMASAEVLHHLYEHPDETYEVNYLRHDKAGTNAYHRVAFANADSENGRKQFVLGFRDVDKLVRTEQAKKEMLQQALTVAQEATAKQEEQIVEISMLNGQLQDNQAKLEEAAAEQEAQLEETRMLNAQLQETKDKISEAYGMIAGLSSEYHTIWVVNKETSRMRLIRSSGKSTIKRAVQMGIDEPAFDPAFDTYIGSCVEPEDRERMHREIAFAEVLRHLSEHPDQLYAVNYLRRDDSGHVGYHQIAFANADTEDGVRQFVYGFRDIDKIVKAEIAQKQELEKAKEEAEAANAAKTSFLFNMSHDIRTPMNAIMGFRDLLEKHQEDPHRRQDYLNKIQDASTVLLSIINNVLEMARIEKGTLEIDETAWSAEQFNDTLYSVFREMMQQKGLTFTRQIEVKNNYVYCDPTKLREIFINILSNAYKYTNAGGSVNMHLEEIPSDREGYALYRTTISDTGIGMSEDFLPHIFEEFSREQNTTDAKVEGTGLGMPIVKRLVDMLGGTIEVSSKKGVGSAFVVTIPHRIAQKANLVQHAGVEIDPKLFKDKHILLAEDNDLNAEIAMEILSEAGFIVDRAEDGAVCVDMLKESQDGYYDIILMDIQMPHMNGYDATRAIRTLEDHDKANIKILAMTANAFEEDKREALRAGMNGHLAKPINVGELMKTLTAMIG